jgi:hypothetical protein
LPSAEGSPIEHAAAPARGTQDDFAAVTAELEALGAIDPVARAKLIEDLRQTDPALWPLLIQYFRASVQHQRTSAAPIAAAPVDGALRPAAEPPLFAPIETPAPPRVVTTLPAPAAVPAGAEVPGAVRPAAGPLPGEVVPASYSQPADASDWPTHLASAIAALEADLAGAQDPPDDTAIARYRLMCLAAGRRDDALRAWPGQPAGVQEFWSQELFGLDALLDTQPMADPARRATEAAEHLQSAADALAQSGNLLVRNATFCSQVKGYGVYTRFDKEVFAPGEEVLLYAEVDHLQSEPTPKGHHTALQTRYQIFDAQGRQIDDQKFSLTEEYCQNRRRDFFILFDPLRLPDRAADGRHTLQLTVEDTLAGKVGQATVTFQVRGK